VVGGLTGVLRTAPAIGDELGAERDGLVLGRVQIGVGRRRRLDQDDVAVRADRRDHVDVERLFASPAGVVRWQRAGRAVLVDLAEAAVRDGTGGQAPLAAVSSQVRGGIRVVHRVYDRD